MGKIVKSHVDADVLRELHKRTVRRVQLGYRDVKVPTHWLKQMIELARKGLMK